jgi:PAS domain S-box-containing protein
MRRPSLDLSSSLSGRAEPEAICVLAVDDEPDRLERTADLLEREDDRLTVVTETSTADGLGRLAADDVDCVVSAHGPPRVDGLEFLEAVRDEHGDVPFILYTDSGSEQLASDVISAGVTEYLRRDVDGDTDEELVEQIIDATEQFDRARELDRYREFMRHSPDVAVILDEEGTVAYQSAAPDDPDGFEPRDMVGETPETYVHPDDRERMRRHLDRVLDSDAGEVIRTELRIRDASDEFHWYEIRATNYVDRDPVDGVLVTSRKIADRKGVERSLARYASTVTQLQETTRRLLKTTEPAVVAEIAIEGIEKAFEFDVAGMWLQGESDDRLEPAAITDRGAELIESQPTYSAGEESISWEAFQNQTTRIIDRMNDQERRHNPETPVQSELVVPVGEYGVLNIGSTEPCAFSERDRHRVEVWGSTVESALARVDQFQRMQKREEELRRERERLDEFTGFVSHDLRNPLTVATGRLQLAMTEQESAHLDAVEEALDRMEQLIQDLLKLTRQGATVGEKKEVRLRELVSRCWSSVETHDAELVVRAATATERPILADGSRLMSLVENLVRNAVEHGSPEVTVTVGGLDDEDGFYVADDGVGIPESEREAVFRSGYSTANGGSGLGLAIVKQTADAHGWDIRVTESSEGGARFEITNVEFAR